MSVSAAAAGGMGATFLTDERRRADAPLPPPLWLEAVRHHTERGDGVWVKAALEASDMVPAGPAVLLAISMLEV